MPGKEYIAELGDWQGFAVGTTGRLDSDASDAVSKVWIELFPDRSRPVSCSGCGGVVESVHDWTQRWVRDLPAWGAETSLLVHFRRMKCARCGTAMEEIPWLSPYARVTKRLAQSVARLCREVPIRHVAEHFGLSWDRVKRIHKAYLKEELGEPELSGITEIGMDEFAIQKGHRYATVIIEPRTRRVLWVGRGRGREDVRPFFEKLGKQACEQLQAAVMDMWEPYEQEVRMHCPNAKIVYDLFHIKSKYGREVVDRVRVDEANRLKRDRPARQVVKGAKWILLRNETNLRPNDRIRLRELLAANHRLATVHVLKEDLAHLWDYKYEGAARRFWKAWYDRAIRSRIEPLKRFAKLLKERLPGILAHCKHALNTSVIEGVNNKIKVIKRMAYGFRDDEYFFLRIREAFPGNCG